MDNLEQGGDLESCLARFPGLVDELRPILTAAVQARSIVVTDVPSQAVNRGRARVLQAAAEMREQDSAAIQALPASRVRIKSKNILNTRFYRLAITTAAMLAFLATGGTGLVNASSSALPGDQLYSVKRSWEDVRLFFVFDASNKKQLENEFDHKRLQEIEELYSEKRIAQVDFQGDVQALTKDGLVIGGLNIAINSETNLDDDISKGATVHITGETDDGVIKASQIVIVATPWVVQQGGLNPTQGSPVPADASRTPSSTEMQDEGNSVQQDNQVLSATSTAQHQNIPEPDPTKYKASENNSTGSNPSENNTPDPQPTRNRTHENHPNESQPPQSHPTEDGSQEH